ncbi:MAG TPA: AraC family transcriptional regulator [Chitinophaga sp.]
MRLGVMHVHHDKQKGIKEGFVGQQMAVLPPNIKRLFTKNPLTKNFYLTAIGYYPKATNHDRERKSGSDQYILIYCIEGEGDIFLHDKAYVLKANSYFIIPRNVPHRYTSYGANSWSIYWVHFSGELAPLIYHRFATNHQPVAVPVPYDEARIRLFEQILHLVEHSYNEREMEILNFKLWSFVNSFVYLREANPAINPDDVVGSSIEFMKKRLHKKFTIEELAQQQGLSVSHYARIFKQKTGISPINYFNQLKVQKACQYLYFTERSIKEISAELGVDDPYYFSRLFSKVIGVSPAGYRKRHRGARQP